MAETEFNEEIIQDSNRPLSFKEQLSVNNKKSPYYIENYSQKEKEVLNKKEIINLEKQVASPDLRKDLEIFMESLAPEAPVASELKNHISTIIENMEKNNGQRNPKLETQILNLLEELHFKEMENKSFRDLEYMILGNTNGVINSSKHPHGQNKFDENISQDLSHPTSFKGLKGSEKEIDSSTPSISITSELNDHIFTMIEEMEKNNGQRNPVMEIEILSSLAALHFEERENQDFKSLEYMRLASDNSLIDGLKQSHKQRENFSEQFPDELKQSLAKRTTSGMHYQQKFSDIKKRIYGDIQEGMKTAKEPFIALQRGTATDTQNSKDDGETR